MMLLARSCRMKGATRRRWAPLAVAPLLALLALLTLAGCGAQAGDWRLIGPGAGANVYSVVADPHVAGLIYAGGDGGVYRTLADQSGQVANGDGIPHNAIVTSLLPDPARAGVIFAGTTVGLYRSAHYGDQWSAAGAGLPGGSAAVALAATPDDAILLAGVDNGGIYRSVNDGATWVASGAGLPAHATPVALAWDASDHLWLLGLVSGGAESLYVSADDGQTWNPRATGLPANAQVNALALLGGANAAPTTLFAATTAGLYSSADAGKHWRPVSGGLPQGGALALATLPQQPTWLYVSIVSAVYHSSDGGASWSLVAPGLTSAAQGLAVTEGKRSGPVVFVAAGQVARYPTGVAANTGGLGGVALALIALTLLIGGYVISRRMRRFGYAMGALRNERNTGRAAEAAQRWGDSLEDRQRQHTGTSAQTNVQTSVQTSDESRVIMAPERPARATTSAPADESKAAQNGHKAQE